MFSNLNSSVNLFKGNVCRHWNQKENINLLKQFLAMSCHCNCLEVCGGTSFNWVFFYYFYFFFFESSFIQSLWSLMESLLVLDEFWMCFLARVSVLGIKFDRPLGWSLVAVIDCRVLVIFTLHEVVEMTQGCRVTCGEGIICHFLARRDLQEWHFEAWFYCSVLIEPSDSGCSGEAKQVFIHCDGCLTLSPELFLEEVPPTLNWGICILCRTLVL